MSKTAPTAGWSLTARDPDTIRAWMPIWEWFYEHYFRVQTAGWEQIAPTGNFLFVGSHNGGLASPDLPMFMVDWFRRFGYERPIFGLTHPKVWAGCPDMAQLAVKMGAVRAEPQIAIAALRQGASVLVYPGGAQDVFRPYAQRHQIYLAGRTGFIKLALRESVPIIPLISWGAHATLRILGDIYPLMSWLHQQGMPWFKGIDPEVFPIYLGLPWGLALGPLPNFPFPSQIHTRVCAPIVFEKYGRAAATDTDYVNHCYGLVLRHMQTSLNQMIAAVEG